MQVEQKIKKEMYWKPNSFIPDEYEYILEVDSDDMVNPKILEIYFNTSVASVNCDTLFGNLSQHSTGL